MGSTGNNNKNHWPALLSADAESNEASSASALEARGDANGLFGDTLGLFGGEACGDVHKLSLGAPGGANDDGPGSGSPPVLLPGGASWPGSVDDITDSPELLRQKLRICQDELEHLRTTLATQADLHLFSPLITRFYTEIYRSVRARFQANSDGYSSFPYTNWMELFSAASSETERYDDYAVDERPLTQSILVAMRDVGGLTEEDWDTLQQLRQRRNLLSHPTASVEAVRDSLSARWRENEAHAALEKVVDAVERLNHQQAARRVRRSK